MEFFFPYIYGYCSNISPSVILDIRFLFRHLSENGNVSEFESQTISIRKKEIRMNHMAHQITAGYCSKTKNMCTRPLADILPKTIKKKIKRR